MKLVLQLIFLALQVIVTFLTLMAIYMLFVIMDYQGGIDNFIGTTLIQPILGGLLSAVTGWFVTAFSILHAFPPRKLMQWIEARYL